MPTPRSIEIPSKVMLIGEYGVLAGGPAIMAPAQPRFTLQIVESENFEHPFQANSPAGRLLESAFKRDFELLKNSRLIWLDPIGGRGGLGESTASFVAVVRWLTELGILSGDTRALWHLYRKLQPKGMALLPSGADLLVQAEASWLLVGPVPDFVPFKEPRLASQIQVFSATHLPNRKVRTHEHLQKIDEALVQKVKSATLQVMAQAVAAIIQNKTEEFGRALNSFAESLFKLDLEHPQTTRIRRKLQNTTGVFGVKGCGALMADTLIVLTSREAGPAIQAQVEKEFGLIHLSGALL